MKAILAVELEEELTAGLVEALHRRGLGARMQSVTAERAAEAIRQGTFDLVVVDLGDRSSPPPGLLPALAEGSSGTSLVVLAGDGLARDPEGSRLFEGIDVLDRRLPVGDLSALLVAALQRGVKGHLENVGLAAFTQLLSIEKESCTLEIRAGGRMGTVRFLRGELWDAEIGGKRGDEAALEIFSWETANVDMSGVWQQARRTVDSPLPYLLIEAMRRRDEQERDAAAAPEPPRAAQEGSPANLLIGGLTQAVEGFIAACLVDAATGLTIVARTNRPALDLELAAAFSRESLRQMLELVAALRLSSALEDLVFTFTDQIHVIKPSNAGVFLYLIVDRASTNFPQMRSALQGLWPAFEMAAAATDFGWTANDPALRGRKEP